jgi:hypothetical protein
MAKRAGKVSFRGLTDDLHGLDDDARSIIAKASLKAICKLL